MIACIFAVNKMIRLRENSVLVRWVLSSFSVLMIISACAVRKNIETVLGLPVVEKNQPAKTSHSTHSSCEVISTSSKEVVEQKSFPKKALHSLLGANFNSPFTINNYWSIDHLFTSAFSSGFWLKKKIPPYILFCNLKIGDIILRA